MVEEWVVLSRYSVWIKLSTWWSSCSSTSAACPPQKNERISYSKCILCVHQAQLMVAIFYLHWGCKSVVDTGVTHTLLTWQHHNLNCDVDGQSHWPSTILPAAQNRLLVGIPAKSGDPVLKHSINGNSRVFFEESKQGRVITGCSLILLWQENVSCLNTSLVILMLAHKNSELPLYLEALRTHVEPHLLTNLRSLLRFWQTHYLHNKDKDCNTLQRVSVWRNAGCTTLPHSVRFSQVYVHISLSYNSFYCLWILHSYSSWRIGYTPWIFYIIIFIAFSSTEDAVFFEE